MNKADYQQFAALLDDTWEINPNWRPLSGKGKALFFAALERYSLDAFHAGLLAHIKDPARGRFQPMPADIAAQIESLSPGDGRPGADEAWAIALVSQDESETVVWTSEMAEAFAVCSPVLQAGDEVGARMAFKDAYNRLVLAARNGGKPASWSASLGWDSAKRDAALAVAHRAGRLPAPVMQNLLPNYTEKVDTWAGNAPEGLKRLKEEMAKLKSADEKAAEMRDRRLQEERAAVAARKAELAAQVTKVEKAAP